MKYPGAFGSSIALWHEDGDVRLVMAVLAAAYRCRPEVLIMEVLATHEWNQSMIAENPHGNLSTCLVCVIEAVRGLCHGLRAWVDSTALNALLG